MKPLELSRQKKEDNTKYLLRVRNNVNYTCSYLKKQETLVLAMNIWPLPSAYLPPSLATPCYSVTEGDLVEVLKMHGGQKQVRPV